jgi:hypothetical protein
MRNVWLGRLMVVLAALIAAPIVALVYVFANAGCLLALGFSFCGICLEALQNDGVKGLKDFVRYAWKDGLRQ